MENIHPLVIGIHSAENYEKLKKIIHGISFIADWSIDQIITYEMRSHEKRVKEKNRSFSDSGCGRAEGVVICYSRPNDAVASSGRPTQPPNDFQTTIRVKELPQLTAALAPRRYDETWR